MIHQSVDWWVPPMFGTERRVSATEARVRFGELLDGVAARHDVVIGERAGKEVAAARDGLRRVMNLPIELHSGARLHATLENAYALRLPATYDAHYVALTERFRVPLWTSDHRLADALNSGEPKVHLVP